MRTETDCGIIAVVVELAGMWPWRPPWARNGGGAGGRIQDADLGGDWVAAFAWVPVPGAAGRRIPKALGSDRMNAQTMATAQFADAATGVALLSCGAAGRRTVPLLRQGLPDQRASCRKGGPTPQASGRGHQWPAGAERRRFPARSGPAFRGSRGSCPGFRTVATTRTTPARVLGIVRERGSISQPGCSTCSTCARPLERASGQAGAGRAHPAHPQRAGPARLPCGRRGRGSRGGRARPGHGPGGCGVRLCLPWRGRAPTACRGVVAACGDTGAGALGAWRRPWLRAWPRRPAARLHGPRQGMRCAGRTAGRRSRRNRAGSGVGVGAPVGEASCALRPPLVCPAARRRESSPQAKTCPGQALAQHGPAASTATMRHQIDVAAAWAEGRLTTALWYMPKAPRVTTPPR